MRKLNEHISEHTGIVYIKRYTKTARSQQPAASWVLSWRVRVLFISTHAASIAASASPKFRLFGSSTCFFQLSRDTNRPDASILCKPSLIQAPVRSAPLHFKCFHQSIYGLSKIQGRWENPQKPLKPETQNQRGKREKREERVPLYKNLFFFFFST